ncbi:hypothetical protein BDF20DRAFT_877879 [Mycotypha africana]|uniref:uncharacterized protein n=1 Tax=Mycotypha africana TaxID=64632 RepID=UPI0023012E37|nr:uncharacterized protein BDF20DRAFT_877879 [Mycotypha africana]KAI8975308.1 hypothetical protein BDF20DRAFT_877879 [Mycotypha africana]
MRIDSLATIAKRETSTLCSTTECTQAAESILASIDFNVDPCSDFYQYTCGSWLNQAVIQPDRSSAGTLDSASDVNIAVMKEILEGTYDDVYKNLTSNTNGFHVEDQEKADKDNFDTLKNYYDLCKDLDRANALGPTPIYKDVATIENELTPEKQEENGGLTNAISRTITLLQKLDIDSLNVMTVDTDDKHPDMNIIVFDQVKLGLPSKEYYENEDTLNKYKNGLTDILTKVIGQYSNGTEDDAVREDASAQVGFKRWSDDKVQNAVDRFIEFEKQLAKIALKADEMQDPVQLYNPMKLSEFQAQHNKIDWTSIIQALLPSESNLQSSDTTVIVRTPTFYDQLEKLLSSSSNAVNASDDEEEKSNYTVSPQTLQEYFVITYVLSRTYALDDASRAAFRKMRGEIVSGTSVEQPRWRMCVSYTSQTFPESLGRYYTLNRFGSEDERQKTEVLLTSIHDAWMQKLEKEIDWLDETTRKKAIEKVQLIKHKVAYSTVTPDVRQPDSIKEYNDGLYVDQKSFYDTENVSAMWNSRKTWNKFGRKVDKDEWYMSPQTVNAYYSPNSNEIAIPAGILQSPLYNAKSPAYLNYGGIGSVIGHELTHAFDSSGRKYDGNGNLVDWWTNTTAAQFDANSQCYVEQYSRFTVLGADGKPINVNGKLTLGENLADNGGLSAALSAYRNATAGKESETLPGLEKLSPEALFFVNYGRNWCRIQRPEVAVQMIYIDPHSPTRARVNGAIQNNPDFAKAFNCPVGSPMNPEKKCSMW